jgi:hypothetical protein
MTIRKRRKLTQRDLRALGAKTLISWERLALCELVED